MIGVNLWWDKGFFRKMEMMINMIGMGVAVPKTGFGVNLYSGSYIGFRQSDGVNVTSLGLQDILSLGSRSGTFVLGWVRADWFPIDTAMHPWALVPKALVGSKVELEVSNTLVGIGSVDLKFTLFTNGGDGIPLVSKVDVESVGFQLADTKVRGVIGDVLL